MGHELTKNDISILSKFFNSLESSINKYAIYGTNDKNFLDILETSFTILDNKESIIYNKEKTLLTTSIPYDKNWNVKINGKSIKTRVNQNIFLAVDLSNLNYQTGDVLNVDLSYHANEFTFALIISFISIAYILLYDYKYYEKIKEKFFNKKGKVKENSIKTNDATKSKKETDNGVA